MIERGLRHILNLHRPGPPVGKRHRPAGRRRRRRSEPSPRAGAADKGDGIGVIVAFEPYLPPSASGLSALRAQRLFHRDQACFQQLQRRTGPTCAIFGPPAAPDTSALRRRRGSRRKSASPGSRSSSPTSRSVRYLACSR